MTIESGIVAILEQLPEIRASEGWPNTINTPAAIVDGPLTYDEADMAGGSVSQVYEISLLFSLGVGIARARESVMPYLATSGPRSIRAALYAAPTLGGNAEAFLWRGVTGGPGRVLVTGKGLQAEIPVEEYFGVTFQLEAIST